MTPDEAKTLVDTATDAETEQAATLLCAMTIQDAIGGEEGDCYLLSGNDGWCFVVTGATASSPSSQNDIGSQPGQKQPEASQSGKVGTSTTTASRMPTGSTPGLCLSSWWSMQPGRLRQSTAPSTRRLIMSCQRGGARRRLQVEPSALTLCIEL
jgi:hypothetical protein